MEEIFDARARRSITLLVVAQVGALSMWFSTVAVLPSLAASIGEEPGALAGLSVATQLGFVIGAMTFSISGLPDRLDPRVVFAASGLAAAAANAALLELDPRGYAALLSRAAVGAGLAGVYPVGLKIAVGWSRRRRGFLTSLLVGALTLGSAAPHLIVWTGGADWRMTLIVTSLVGVGAALLIAGVGLGPFHARAARFRPDAIVLAWTDRRIRAAFGGYLGHMWELYAFWSWVGAAALAAAARAGHDDPVRFGSAVAFLAIALGGIACLPAGRLADRIGKARVARGAMLASAASGVAAAIAFEADPFVLASILIVWGIAIIPDSAQFSALVADHAPSDRVGSLMTLQTALGFGLTAVTVRATPWVVDLGGWPLAFVGLAVGPVLGAWVVGGAHERDAG